LGLTLFRRIQSTARSSGTFLAPGEVPSTALDPQKRGATIRESLAAYTEGAKYGKPSADDLKIVSFDFVLIGDYASADKWLTLAVEWNPADAEGWYYLGRAKYNENRFEEAIQAFQKCLVLRPRYVLAANGVGLSYEGLNRMPEAITWLQNAISWQEGVQQKSPEPYIDMGELLTQQARFDEALPILQKAVALDLRNIRAHEKLGKVFISLNRLPEAQNEIEQTIALDPDRAAPHYLLGQIYRKLGQMDKARSELDRFQVLKSKEPPAKSGMQ
jgi:tetratricopeptide (TPR) repeat protein